MLLFELKIIANIVRYNQIQKTLGTAAFLGNIKGFDCGGEGGIRTLGKDVKTIGNTTLFRGSLHFSLHFTAAGFILNALPCNNCGK